MTNSSSDRSDSCSNFFMLEIDAALRDIKATEDILERPKLETCFPFGNFFGRLEFVFNERASCQVSFSRQGTVRIEIMWICIFRRESGQRRMSISCSMLSPLPFPSLASCTKAKNSLGRFFPLCHIFKSHMWVRDRERESDRVTRTTTTTKYLLLFLFFGVHTAACQRSFVSAPLSRLSVRLSRNVPVCETSPFSSGVSYASEFSRCPTFLLSNVDEKNERDRERERVGRENWNCPLKFGAK